MNEIQQLLASYKELEEEMIRFSTLVKEVMASITMQEFVPEKANTSRHCKRLATHQWDIVPYKNRQSTGNNSDNRSRHISAFPK